MFVDSHCHLDKLKLTKSHGIDHVLNEARAAQVEHMLCIGVTLDDFHEMQSIVGSHSEVSFSCGVHPLYVAKHGFNEQGLRDLCKREDVVAVGETGLDYYYDKEHHRIQQDSFACHVDIATTLKKPLIIHTRDARSDTIDILRNGHAERCGGVMHCFTESLEMAEQAMDLGFYISISGIATFANAKELREVVRHIPLERLLIETDSPWLAPVPYRGKENQPGYVQHVAQCVAELKDVGVDEVAATTRHNFYHLFGVQPTPLASES
ncbi:TatD family deoxyribonuclease [Aliidiomarina halalkaliphila]|uniref:TatD family deoxyribonuclease n=1 Tax=Aliidiomarina halalkaliphila TaxID=2593535 RepID=A0A552X5B4_9GAMM|nr:TatD family hydrolase [Aliidiomarina halalkaliphila]TRW49793.1 TatD family deoxyribonuclease [Aliidiomarina halalkaliphila]